MSAAGGCGGAARHAPAARCAAYGPAPTALPRAVLFRRSPALLHLPYHSQRSCLEPRPPSAPPRPVCDPPPPSCPALPRPAPRPAPCTQRRQGGAGGALCRQVGRRRGTLPQVLLPAAPRDAVYDRGAGVRPQRGQPARAAAAGAGAAGASTHKPFRMCMRGLGAGRPAVLPWRCAGLRWLLRMRCSLGLAASSLLCRRSCAGLRCVLEPLRLPAHTVCGALALARAWLWTCASEKGH